MAALGAIVPVLRLTMLCFPNEAPKAVPHRRQLKHYNEFLKSLIASLTTHDFGCWPFVIMPEHAITIL